MSISILSPHHISTTFTAVPPQRRRISSSVRTQSPVAPPSKPQSSVSLNPSNHNSTSLSSSSCALNCPHFQSCSGYTHEYDLHRPSVVDEAADFFKRLGVLDFTFDTCRLYGWKCRAKLAIRGSSINPLIGLYQEAHHPSINSAVELLRKGITELNVEPYDEDLGTGELRYVQMAVTTHNTSLPFSDRYRKGKVQVSLVWNSRSETSPSSETLNDLASFLWRKGGERCDIHLIHSVWANFQTSKNNIIFGNRWRHLFGERDFWENVGGIDVYMTPSSFGQANTRLKEEKRPWVLRERKESIYVESKTNWPESGALPRTLVYISCGWDSFKKDCKDLLSSKAWHLDKAHGFNFFPGTQSIEVLAIFRRDAEKKGKKKAYRKKLKKP